MAKKTSKLAKNRLNPHFLRGFVQWLNTNYLLAICLAVVVIILSFATVSAFLVRTNNQVRQFDSLLGPETSADPDSWEESGMGASSSGTEKVNTTGGVAPSGEPTLAPSAATSPSPRSQPSPTSGPTTPPANPPKIRITYPADQQYIEYNGQAQQLCVVDVPDGGNTSGLQRKHRINGGSWTEYQAHFTLCFSPQEGSNTIELTYKNNQGETSPTYTRTFSFHLVQPISVSVSGQIYRDSNCSGSRDSGETDLDTSATVNFFSQPGFVHYASVVTGSQGTFSYSTEITEDTTLNLEVAPVSPEGYKSNPHFTMPVVSFNSGNRSAHVEIPQVPNADVGNCF